MSQPTLNSTHIGINTINRKMSPIDPIPVGTKTPYTKPLTRPTESTEENGKGHILDDLDPYPLMSDSPSKKKKRDKKKNRCKHRKDDSADPSSRDDSNLSYNSDYRRKRRKRKNDSEKGSDQMMRTFNGKVADDIV